VTTEYRIQELELGYEELRDRVVELEQRSMARMTPVPTPAPVRSVQPPAPEPKLVPREEVRAQPAVSFEDLLGGRILALIGAVAVVLAGAFFFALAVSNGWIGETARTVLAAIGSTGLLAFGMWLHERKGRTYASLSVTGAALACLFLTVTVAAEVYDLIPAAVALWLALLVGACGTVLAVRWSAVPIGAIGIVGALLSPVLAGAPQTGTTLALLFVANAAAVAVLLWQRWDWLGFATFVVAAPQWIGWLFDSPSPPAMLLTLLAFGALGVGTAIGFELRVPLARLRGSSAFLLALNAITLALAGWFALQEQSGRDLAELWLCFLAVAHLAVGVASYRLDRISRDVGLLVLVTGVLLADIAFSLIVSGVAVAVGYATAGLVFAWLLRGVDKGGLPEALVSIGLGGHLLLSLAHALAVEAPPMSLDGEPFDLLSAIVALGSLTAALFGAARLSSERHEAWRVVLDSAGLAVVAYMAALAFGGALLVAFLAVGAVVLSLLARRTGDLVLSVAAMLYLSTGVLHAVAIEAMPESLIYGTESLAGAAVALGTCGLAALACARLSLSDGTWRLGMWGGGAITLLYLASVAIVTAFQPGGAETTVLELPVRQQGQVLVSALWGVAGLVALLAGLRKDMRELRIGALALLLAAVAKVFLYDLATLGSAYRAASFLALGALLLAASFAYQRLRPTPLPDLREVSRALR
jgi:uncharacterized membrane protein